ncbi:MAG: class I SAM-dependent methyltransferase [Cuniculiplasma sp.]
MENEKVVFDEIADHYDSTRGALDEKELNSLIKAMEGCKSILEIGAGTGRIMKPLLDHGFDITGVDISRKMLEKAKEKGLGHLVIGNADNLPFLDRSFDATLLIHVFHLIEDKRAVMMEAKRVTNRFILALIRERQVTDDSHGVMRQGSRKILDEVAEKYGYRLNLEHANTGKTDKHILEEFPASRKIFVSNYVYNRKPENFVDRFRYSSRFVRIAENIPKNTLDKILEEAKLKIISQNLESIETKVSEYLVIWDLKDIE